MLALQIIHVFILQTVKLDFWRCWIFSFDKCNLIVSKYELLEDAMDLFVTKDIFVAVSSIFNPDSNEDSDN